MTITDAAASSHTLFYNQFMVLNPVKRKRWNSVCEVFLCGAVLSEQNSKTLKNLTTSNHLSEKKINK